MATTKRPMIGVRAFRTTFQDLTEPTDVVKAKGKVERIGTWIPEKDRILEKKETKANGDA